MVWPIHVWFFHTGHAVAWRHDSQAVETLEDVDGQTEAAGHARLALQGQHTLLADPSHGGSQAQLT